MGGIGPPPGNCVLGLTGSAGCSGTQIDSKPSDSATRANSAGCAFLPVKGVSSPIFIGCLLEETESFPAEEIFRKYELADAGGLARLPVDFLIANHRR